MELRDCEKYKSYTLVARGFDNEIGYEMRGIFLGFTKFLGEKVGVFQGPGSFMYLIRPEDAEEVEERRREFLW